MRKVLLLWGLCLMAVVYSNAQIISSQPVFAGQNDTITIIYDATAGNGALTNLGPPEVFAHTGVITDKSATSSSWRYVQGEWGTNDPKVRMTYLGMNKYQIRFHIRSFYGVPADENILKLAFVFRNRSGSIVGRESDNSDIFYDLYDQNLACRILLPENGNFVMEKGDTLRIEAASSLTADLDLKINGTSINSSTDNAITHHYVAKDTGDFTLSLNVNSNGQNCGDSLNFVVRPIRPLRNMPAGREDGITYLTNTSVHLQLFAPGKEYVYVLGDFNNWQLNNNYLMHQSEDGNTFWLEISGLEPSKPYAFQYAIDDEIRVGDPYTEIILDPFNDPFIPEATYADLPPYPAGKTTGITAVLQTNQNQFNWTDQNYQRPEKTDLVIYELLVRDFIGAQNYKTLVDTLDYLSRLGINAIELMPVNEFEGNLSWGYNPSYHGALDKYYGSKNDFKAFVDECHSRGIAVIVDAVFNHAFSQSPLCQMYWDAVNFRPSPDNPWLNVIEKHPFNVGYDFNHESAATQKWMDKLLKYWVEEYHIDGYRFDLSKGFTQNNTLGDVGAWGRYDADRVRLLKRMTAKLWDIDPGLYMIMEHFADNSEETELANSGMMFWGNLVNAYNEACMGYNADMNWGSYKNRGWNDPHLVTCLETHDEERLMYKTMQFGNASGDYNTRNKSTALDRVELAAALFFPIPGPKMIWQFTEVGYDVSINFNGRTGNKPIRWEYYDEPDRRDLYEVFADLIHLRIKEPAFKTRDFNVDLSSAVKRIWLNHSDMDVLVVGNCDVKDRLWRAGFQKSGTWYEFFSGDTLVVTDTDMDLDLKAGEYRLYTTKKVERIYKNNTQTNSIIPLVNEAILSVYPNPARNVVHIDFSARMKMYQLKDLNGRVVNEGRDTQIDLSGLSDGLYMLEVEDVTGNVYRHKLIKQ